MNAPPKTFATLAALLDDAVTALGAAGLAKPAFEARALLSGVLGLGREEILAHPHRPVDAVSRARFADALGRRAGCEPLARITGQREFWSLPIGLGTETLIPRPDSETVVEATLLLVADRDEELSVLDLGTGSGCLLFALLAELPRARGLGIDRAEGALAVARANGRRLGLSARAEFRVGDWAEGLAGPFDIIVSNPPYVAAGDWAALPPEVRDFEPELALNGGRDGLGAYRALIPGIAPLIAPDGFGVVELGAGQHDQVAEICRNSGLFTGPARQDLGGHQRALPLARSREALEIAKTKKKVGKKDVPV
jgi:release factor glutamine methyltransferase